MFEVQRTIARDMRKFCVHLTRHAFLDLIWGDSFKDVAA
jgi:hypothetical protein